jgi:hypothetical protein
MFLLVIDLPNVVLYSGCVMMGVFESVYISFWFELEWMMVSVLRDDIP